MHHEIEAVILDVGHTLLYPSEVIVAQVVGFDALPNTYYLALRHAHTITFNEAVAASERIGTLVAETAVRFFEVFVSKLYELNGRGGAPFDMHLRLIQIGSSLWSGIFPDSRAFVELCRARNLAIAVLSNSDGGSAELLARCGLGPFAHIYDSARIGYRKPDPRAFLYACRGLGVLPARCLYVGDSLVIDGVGACAAGMQAVIIRRYLPEILISTLYFADVTIESFSTLDDVAAYMGIR